MTARAVAEVRDLHVHFPVRHGRTRLLARAVDGVDLTIGEREILALKGAAKRDVFEREATGDPAIQPIAALLAANVDLEVVWTEG